MKSRIRFAVCTGATLALLAQTPKPPADKPQYFDEPAFIAAGVTDPTLRAGHGSGAVMRSAEALVKATASLSKSGPPSTTGQSLRAAISREPDNAALHHSLAEVEETAARPVEALREYRRAAELDASETNIYDLGAELLIHRAAEQASEVFVKGARLFPRSSRMLLALAVAYYWRGSYDQARERFFQAIDLNPADPAPYALLDQVQSAEITQSSGFAERVERFAMLRPDSAAANYYYAASLLRRARGLEDAPTEARARTLLEKSVRLDPALSVAWLALGVLHADRNDYTKAISAWQRAAAASPRLEEPHYRLALAYRKTGDAAKAKPEMDLYEQLSKQSAAEFERENAGIQQFVFTLRDTAR